MVLHGQFSSGNYFYCIRSARKRAWKRETLAPAVTGLREQENRDRHLLAIVLVHIQQRFSRRLPCQHQHRRQRGGGRGDLPTASPWQELNRDGACASVR